MGNIVKMASCTIESGLYCAPSSLPCLLFNVYLEINYHHIRVQDASSTNCEIGLAGNFWKPCCVFLKVEGALDRNRNVVSDGHLATCRGGSPRKSEAAYQPRCPDGHGIC